MYQLAEFIGIMLGDGYLVDTRFKVSLNAIDDKEYAPYVVSLIEHLFNTNPILKPRKTDNTLDIFVFKRKIIRQLLSFGLVKSPKWNRAKVPDMFLAYPTDVLRGYVDSDGCVAMVNNNGYLYPRIEMKISPSPMQEQLIQMLNDLQFRFGVYQIGKGKVRIQLNGVEQLRKWNDLIGFSHPKNIQKAQYFLEKK